MKAQILDWLSVITFGLFLYGLRYVPNKTPLIIGGLLYLVVISLGKVFSIFVNFSLLKQISILWVVGVLLYVILAALVLKSRKIKEK